MCQSHSRVRPEHGPCEVSFSQDIDSAKEASMKLSHVLSVLFFASRSRRESKSGSTRYAMSMNGQIYTVQNGKINMLEGKYFSVPRLTF